MEHYPQSPSDLSKQVVEYAISDEGANYIETKLAEVTMRVGISCTDDWEGDDLSTLIGKR